MVLTRRQSNAPLVLARLTNGEPVVLSDELRKRNIHVVGTPGTGKSKALEYWLRQDILAGRGLCLLDPHGYLYDDVVAWCAGRRLLGRRKILLLDAASDAWSFGFNPLDLGSSAPEAIARAVDGMIKACAQVWGGEDTSRTPLLRRCLRDVFHVLAEHRLTLLETVPLISAHDTTGLRRHLTRSIRHPLFAAQWHDFNQLKPRDFQEAFASTNNRIIEFIHSPLIARIVGQRDHVLNFRTLMDEGAIVLVRLGGGLLSPDSARLLGSLFVNDLALKAFDRPKGSRPFTLYVDECQRFLNEDIELALEGGRKFGLQLVLAHQTLGQLREAGEGVFRAVFSIAKNKVVFGGLDPEDAELMARSIFAGEFDYEEPKARFVKPMVVGFQKVRLVNASRSSTWSSTSGSTSTDSEGWTEVTSEDEEGRAQGSQSLRGQTSSAESATETAGGGTSRGYGEALAPILAPLPTQGYSLEELRDRAAARLMNLRDRTAIVKIPGRKSIEVETMALEPPRARPEAVARFVAAVRETQGFVRNAEVIDHELALREQQLLEAAREYVNPKEPARFRE